MTNQDTTESTHENEENKKLTVSKPRDSDTHVAG